MKKFFEGVMVFLLICVLPLSLLFWGASCSYSKSLKRCHEHNGHYISEHQLCVTGDGRIIRNWDHDHHEECDLD